MATDLRVPTPATGPITTERRWPYTPGAAAPFRPAEVLQEQEALRSVGVNHGLIEGTLRWPVTSGAAPPFTGTAATLASSWAPRYDLMLPRARPRLLQVGTFAPFMQDLPVETRLLAWDPTYPAMQRPPARNAALWIRARPDTPVETRITPTMWLPSVPALHPRRPRAPSVVTAAPPSVTLTAPFLTAWRGWQPMQLERRAFRAALQSALAWFALVPTAPVPVIASYMAAPSTPAPRWAAARQVHASRDPASWWSPQFAADPLASMWAPIFPPRVPGAPPRPYSGAVEPPGVTAEAVVVVTMWAPHAPAFVRGAPPRPAGGPAVLAMLEFAPALTWSPQYPDALPPLPPRAALWLRARPDVPFAQELPPTSWGPTYPDFVARAPGVGLGGPSTLPLVTTTAPSLAQWLGYGPERILRRTYVVALQPSYVWPTFTPQPPAPLLSSFWRPFSEPTRAWAARDLERWWLDPGLWWQPDTAPDPPASRWYPTVPARVPGAPPVLFSGATVPPLATGSAEELTKWLARYPDAIARARFATALQVPWWWFAETPAKPVPDLTAYYRALSEPHAHWTPSPHAALAPFLLFGGLPGVRPDRGLIFVLHEGAWIVTALNERGIIPGADDERGRVGAGG